MRKARRAVHSQAWSLRRAWLLSAFPGSLLGRLQVLGVFVGLFARYRLHQPTGRPKTLALGTGLAFEIRDHTEALALCEVFIDECYDHPALPEKADVIVDLGCNIGAACVWFKRRYPDARVIGVEADPSTAELARTNTQSLTDVEIANYAVARENGSVTLWRSRQASWASDLYAEVGEAIEVPALSLTALLDNYCLQRVDVLKVDIEGAEHDVFEEPHCLSRVRMIVGEYHPRPGKTWSGFVEKMLGFAVTADGSSVESLDFGAVRNRSSVGLL